ncbi:hypothetical protein Agub_g925 [Astrephomene gubernaculifera]|uniref:RING-CH-type domain-containing protein n=1 Tax=Astrephomene gubernaculifera TaxID=47775 RepID=A0AAD3DEI9_9CHLO|nr:hypothetical protein Agub_g925 [Astrephomene gubernaculifera]
MRGSSISSQESAEENERLLGNPTASSSEGHDAVPEEATTLTSQQDAKAKAERQGVSIIPASAQQPESSTSGPTDGRSSCPGISPAPATHSRTSSIDRSVPGGSDAGAPKGEPMLCRICLEEDSVSNLEQPCACAGTQKYAHHECIQRWVNEKGHLRCEICDQQYRGSFTVPPQPAAVDDPHGLFAPMFAIRVDPLSGDPLIGPAGHRDRAALDFLDESDHYYQRNPLASWCFTFVIFVMFLVVLHHTMLVADGMDDTGDASVSPSPSPSSGSTDGDSYASSLTLFLFWIGTKAFLIGIPLYTVMRIAARQARREQYEAMLRSAAFEVPSRRFMWRMQIRNQERAPGAGGGQAAAAPVGSNIV